MKKWLIAVSAASMFLSGSAFAENRMPWVFYSKFPDGNTLRLDALEPLAGSPLLQGQQTSITLTFSYTLQTAEKAVITLDFTDQKARKFLGDRPKVTQEVLKDGSPVTMTDTFVIPPKAKEIWLSVRFKAEGKRSEGNILIRWPVWVPVANN